jgi:hypothetical protein
VTLTHLKTSQIAIQNNAYDEIHLFFIFLGLIVACGVQCSQERYLQDLDETRGDTLLGKRVRNWEYKPNSKMDLHEA